ncbi:MAG: MucR family transcriptional regulator [Hyphomonadaceae bacterium]
MSAESHNEIPVVAKNVIEMTSSIVAAYVSNNSVESADLPVIITSVHDAMMGLQIKGAATRTQIPAVSIKKSISDDYLICLEDGEKFKSLRRHLRSKYDMSPEEYREKWGLGPEYPMVAPSYARQRSELAKKMGLGQNKKSSN